MAVDEYDPTGDTANTEVSGSAGEQDSNLAATPEAPEDPTVDEHAARVFPDGADGYWMHSVASAWHRWQLFADRRGTPYRCSVEAYDAAIAAVKDAPTMEITPAPEALAIPDDEV